MRATSHLRNRTKKIVVSAWRCLASGAWRWCICFCYAVFIGYLSLLPKEAVTGVSGYVPHLDKMVHFVLYGVFAGLLAWAWQISSWAWKRVGVAAIAGPTVYGFLMEVLQLIWVAHDRSFSAADIAANTVGAFFFSTVYLLIFNLNYA